MLINKPKFDISDVITLKLLSGEEVLGKLVSEDEFHITLDKALMIAMTAKGPAMAPILITVDPEKPLTFAKAGVSVIALTEKEIANQYTFQTTGIQPVTAGSIFTG
jgi:hypothetical protein